MPWCENEGCGKRDLKKTEIVFDDIRKRILCVPCGQATMEAGAADLHEEVRDKTWFGIGYTTDQGLKAELVHGGAKMSVRVNNDQIMKILGQ